MPGRSAVFDDHIRRKDTVVRRNGFRKVTFLTIN